MGCDHKLKEIDKGELYYCESCDWTFAAFEVGKCDFCGSFFAIGRGDNFIAVEDSNYCLNCYEDKAEAKQRGC